MMTAFSVTVEQTAGTPKTISGHLAGFFKITNSCCTAPTLQFKK